MSTWLITLLSSIGTLIVTLSVTLLFNKLVALPKEIKKQKEIEKAKEEQAKQENYARDSKIAALEASLNAHVAQSLQIQTQLKSTDDEILNMCNEIKVSIGVNQNLLNTVLNERLDRLEKREKNSIRATLLDEYRLFTDESKNPMLAWSEMEHHAFFELINDYEDLNGNDYVHSTVIPAMNKLVVIAMSDKQELTKLMNSRNF